MWLGLRLVVSTAMFCGALSPAAAQSATTVTGAEDANASLVVAPDADPLVTAFDPASIHAVAFIQRMPVSKMITRVTLGDLASDTSCASPAKIRLSVLEERSGTFEGGSAQQLALSDVVSLPSELAQVAIDLPSPVTLLKGKAYLFRITGTADSCRSAQQRTWDHNGGQVENGPAPCAGSPRLDVDMSGSPMRLWHADGEMDRIDDCAHPYSFDPTMPTGWLLTTSPGSSRVIVTWQLAHGTSVPSTGCGSYQGAGVHWRFWKTFESSGVVYDKWVCQWTQFGAPNADVEDGWYHGAPWVGGRDGRPRDIYLRLDTIDYDALLDRYAPQLRYHYAESYRADSAETMVLVGVPPEGRDESWANNLERENGAVLASSDPLLPYPALTLTALPFAAGANVYPWGDSALDSDRIDARNGTYEQDAALMHQNPSLANRIYARATHGADGKLWLQYWFFYYYNQTAFGILAHEADWEMIQIGLKSDLTPDLATYAQHSGAQSCSWDRVPKYAGPTGIGPVVFVGIGAHESQFYAADPPSYFPEYGSERVRPELDRQIGNIEPTWATWRGRWGGSDQTTVRSPGRQGSKWDNPTGFNSAAGGCPTEAAGAVTARVHERVMLRRVRGRALPPPGLTARRSSRRVAVRYRYSRRAWRRLPRRAGVVLSVRGSAQGSLPRNVMFRLRHRTGRRRLGLPLSPGPYAVQGQTLSRAGAQSRPTTIHLK